MGHGVKLNITISGAYFVIKRAAKNKRNGWTTFIHDDAGVRKMQFFQKSEPQTWKKVNN